VKKKSFVTSKDKSDWLEFTNKLDNIIAKEEDSPKQRQKIRKIRKLDLHGLSLSDANKAVTSFIVESFDSGCEKIFIITGKGLHSKHKDNPYISGKLSVLKNSIPEYIKNNEELIKKINKISKADINDGGEGAICIFLKNNKNL
tara:strand:+ start:709 stop:1140 length:432 start_codon:yes stop_codon:yes gene_type:complete